MASQDDFLPLEKQFWTGDADFYRQNLDRSCLVAFPQMAGLYRREDIVATIRGGGDRWQDINLSVRGFLEPAPGVAILTYEARATRPSGERYSAIASSGYVQRDGAWKMTFHQQTPRAG